MSLDILENVEVSERYLQLSLVYSEMKQKSFRCGSEMGNGSIYWSKEILFLDSDYFKYILNVLLVNLLKMIRKTETKLTKARRGMWINNHQQFVYKENTNWNCIGCIFTKYRKFIHFKKQSVQTVMKSLLDFKDKKGSLSFAISVHSWIVRVWGVLL